MQLFFVQRFSPVRHSRHILKQQQKSCFSSLGTFQAGRRPMCTDFFSILTKSFHAWKWFCYRLSVPASQNIVDIICTRFMDRIWNSSVCCFYQKELCMSEIVSKWLFWWHPPKKSTKMSGLRSASLIVLVTFALVKGKNWMDSFTDKLTGSTKSHLANLHFGAYFGK